MNNKHTLWMLVATVTCSLLTVSCSNKRYSTDVHVGGSVHYGHYWGHPWYRYPRPIIVVPPETEIDPDWGTERPAPPETDVDPDYGVPAPDEVDAMPLPEMGMPDDGGDMGMGMDMEGDMGMDMDMGGFD